MKRYSIVLVMLIIFLSSPVQSAGASSWSANGQGECASGFPRGAAWLVWEGYSFVDFGIVKAGLYWWNGSGYVTMAYGEADKFGASGQVVVNHNTVAHQSGSWVMGSVAGGSFITPSSGININRNFTCP